MPFSLSTYFKIKSPVTFILKLPFIIMYVSIKINNNTFYKHIALIVMIIHLLILTN